MVLQDTLEILGPLMLPSASSTTLGEDEASANEVALEDENEARAAKDGTTSDDKNAPGEAGAAAETAPDLDSGEAPSSTTTAEKQADQAASEDATRAPAAPRPNPLLQGGLSGLAEAAAAREARRAAKLKAEAEEAEEAAAAATSSGSGKGTAETAAVDAVEASASESAPGASKSAAAADPAEKSTSSTGATTTASKQGEPDSSEMAEMQKMLEVYKKLMPMSDDEMKWKQKVLDTSVNTFVVAETREEQAQRR